MNKLTLDLFVEFSNRENIIKTLNSINSLQILSSCNVIPRVHILAKIENYIDIINIKHITDSINASVDIIGYLEPDHQSIEKKCTDCKYVAFMSDGADYDKEFFNKLSHTVYIERKPILFARSGNISCTTRFMYKQFCLDENPMKNIYESCIYKHPELVLDFGDCVATKS